MKRGVDVICTMLRSTIVSINRTKHISAANIATKKWDTS